MSSKVYFDGRTSINLFEKYGPKLDDMAYEGRTPTEIAMLNLWCGYALNKRDVKCLNKRIEELKKGSINPTLEEEYEEDIY